MRPSYEARREEEREIVVLYYKERGIWTVYDNENGGLRAPSSSSKWTVRIFQKSTHHRHRTSSDKKSVTQNVILTENGSMRKGGKPSTMVVGVKSRRSHLQTILQHRHSLTSPCPQRLNRGSQRSQKATNDRYRRKPWYHCQLPVFISKCYLLHVVLSICYMVLPIGYKYLVIVQRQSPRIEQGRWRRLLPW